MDTHREAMIGIERPDDKAVQLESQGGRGTVSGVSEAPAPMKAPEKSPSGV